MGLREHGHGGSGAVGGVQPPKELLPRRKRRPSRNAEPCPAVGPLHRGVRAEPPAASRRPPASGAPQ